MSDDYNFVFGEKGISSNVVVLSDISAMRKPELESWHAMKFQIQIQIQIQHISSVTYNFYRKRKIKLNFYT